MAERVRELIHPMQVIDDQQAPLERAERTMRSLEDAHRLEHGRLLRTEEERLEPPTVARHLRQPPEQRSGGGQRNAAFRLITDDQQTLRTGYPLPCLCEQPTLPTPWLADDDRGGRAGSSGADHTSQRRQLTRTTNERAHSWKSVRSIRCDCQQIGGPLGTAARSLPRESSLSYGRKAITPLTSSSVTAVDDTEVCRSTRSGGRAALAFVEKEHSACAPPGRSRRQCATHAREAPELLILRGGVAVSTGVLEGAQCTRELVSGGAALTGGQPGADRLGRQRIV